MKPELFNSLSITEPQALWLLTLLPLLVLLRERSAAELPPWRSFGALLLRCLAVACLTLAIARPVQIREEPNRALVLAIDASASMSSEQRQSVETWLREFSDESKEAKIRPLLLVLGDSPNASSSIEEALESLKVTSEAEQGTDLGAAIELGLSALPPAASRELILLSDGADSRHQLDDALRVAQAQDIAIHSIHFPPKSPRLRLGRAQAEQDHTIGEEITIRVVVSPDPWPEDTRLQVSRTQDGTLLAESLLLGSRADSSTSELRFVPKEAGLLRLQIQAVSGEDKVLAPPSYLALRVLPKPFALVIGNQKAQSAMGKILNRLEPPLRWIGATELPDDLDETGARLLVLLDPKLTGMSRTKAEDISSWTRSGGRLLVTGGKDGLVTDSEAVEALADLLPIHFPKTKKREQAPLSVLYCLDSSDSMAGSAKFELAASALAQSLRVLPKEARVGILAFADFPTWVAPLAAAPNIEPLVQALSQVRIRGGTSIFHALAEAYSTLKDDEALLRHVILLSDGQSTTTFSRSGDIVTAMAKRGITVSTIAVSKESDRPEMQRISQAGNGRAYYAERFSELPQLFLDETLLVSRTNSVEDRFPVQALTKARALKFVSKPEAIPPILGFVRGRQKAGSELALATRQGDPLLVTSPKGRGQVAVLSTEFAGSWTAPWNDWEEREALWRGILDALLQPQAPRRTRLESQITRSEAVLTYDAVDPLLNPRSDLVVEATIENPDGNLRKARLTPSGPGRYQLRLALPMNGASLVRIAAVGTTDSNSSAAPVAGEWVESLAPGPPEEEWVGPSNPNLLRTLSEATGGMTNPEPRVLAQKQTPSRKQEEPLWPWPLFAGLFSMMLDLSWRRLPWLSREVPE